MCLNTIDLVHAIEIKAMPTRIELKLSRPNSIYHPSAVEIEAMPTRIELKLSRPNRIYRPSEPLQGKIVVKSASSISHYGIRMALNGSVNLQVRGGSAGVIESFYGVVKPITILSKSLDIKPSGKIVSGTTEIPFSIILRNSKEDNLERFYETFHGTNISIQYLATVDIMRGYLHKPLSAIVEFIVESDRADLLDQPIPPEIVIFYITQDTQRHPILPELKSGGFRIIGRISTQRSMLEPLSGELTVEASAIPICSIDIHLLRVESILLGEKIVTETSLIQTTQVADGDVCRNMTLPIYVVLPRLLTCPTVLAGPFSIEFKVAIVISFQSELSKLHPKSDPRTPRLWTAMETLPLELVRTSAFDSNAKD
ncbi:Vacuolar protein sorting-associated protein 26 isoform 1 [Theobroma cacao]|uniref:Vacuolar protein sorting-associated protein 26C n=1 Tax=Theobroma cacao TaxID=3641 RepID=A0A061FUW2_THECC|nr:Vacuolar protein sorting-associated protein 26 isoform 1 [Theobroma cacao]